MKQQDPASQPAPQDIEAAPPAYTAEPGMQDARAGGAGPAVPATNLPADLNSATSQPTPTAAQPVPVVTPLNQLGDQPQWIDCPFCQRRTKTRLNKEGTPMQIVAGVLCCLLCVCLACVPCIAGWFEETDYFCSECNNRVAKRSDNGSIVVYGPQAMVPSKFA